MHTTANDGTSSSGPTNQQRLTGLGIAAIASIAAGIIHAGAIGVHSEHVGLSRLFIAAAVFQIAWGSFALVTNRRWVGLIGAAGNFGIVMAWLITRVADISWISGLEQSESPAFADTACAALGAVAVGGGLVAWMFGDRIVRVPRLALPALAAAALAVPALVSASSHSHAEAGHSHGEDVTADAAGAIGTVTAAGDDGHTHPDDGAAATEAASGDTATDDTSVDGHSHTTEAAADPTDTTAAAPDTTVAHDHTDQVAAIAPVPFDPTKPIDLGGVEGVTPEQQARAENLVAITVLRLPKYADPATAEADGFRSIGDGITGHEHYIKWSYLNDEHVLNPDYPESLVYAVDRATGTKTLVSVMFMLPDGYTLDNAPDIGGALTQWHIHDNLCFAPDQDDPSKIRVVGLTTAEGTCSVGTKADNPNPMIHVWIVPHPCGPFAALEGVAAGQVKPGDTHACDEAHGGGH